MPYILLAVAFSLNAAANILLKLGSLKGLAYQGMTVGQIISHNALALLGLILFGLNAVFYFLALKSVPLSIAYPIMIIMSLLIISAYSTISLKEQLGVFQLVGYALIVAGIALIFLFKK